MNINLQQPPSSAPPPSVSSDDFDRVEVASLVAEEGCNTNLEFERQGASAGGGSKVV